MFKTYTKESHRCCDDVDGDGDGAGGGRDGFDHDFILVKV